MAISVTAVPRPRPFWAVVRGMIAIPPSVDGFPVSKMPATSASIAFQLTSSSGSEVTRRNVTLSPTASPASSARSRPTRIPDSSGFSQFPFSSDCRMLKSPGSLSGSMPTPRQGSSSGPLIRLAEKRTRLSADVTPGMASTVRSTSSGSGMVIPTGKSSFFSKYPSRKTVRYPVWLLTMFAMDCLSTPSSRQMLTISMANPIETADRAMNVRRLKRKTLRNAILMRLDTVSPFSRRRPASRPEGE